MRRWLTPEKSQTLATTTKLIFWVNLSTKSKDGVNMWICIEYFLVKFLCFRNFCQICVQMYIWTVCWFKRTCSLSCKQLPICSLLRTPPTESSLSERQISSSKQMIPSYLIHIEDECKEFALWVVAWEEGSVDQGGRVEGEHNGRVDRVGHSEEDDQNQNCKMSNLLFAEEKTMKSAFTPIEGSFGTFWHRYTYLRDPWHFAALRPGSSSDLTSVSCPRAPTMQEGWGRCPRQPWRWRCTHPTKSGWLVA